VIQVLQERRQLLFGPRPAKYLSAVSGGSYTAAAFMCEAVRQASLSQPEGLPPLAHGSPEEEHILGHASYFRSLTALGRITVLAALNLASILMLVIWLGWPFSVARMGRPLFAAVPALDGFLVTLPPSVLILGCAIALWLMAKGLYAGDRVPRFLLPLVGIVVLVASARDSLDWAETHVDWWTLDWLELVVARLAAAVTVLTAVTFLARSRGVTGRPAQVLNILTVLGPRAIMLIIVAWSAVWWDRQLLPILNEDGLDHLDVGGFFFATLFLTFGFSYVPNRASLHRAYRDLVGSCFAVRRSLSSATTVEPAPFTFLSSLDPPGGAKSFPRLLAMGTANVPLHDAHGHRRSYGAFAFSHDLCGVPGQPGASFSTKQLELLDEPAGIFTLRKERLVSLMTAVATSGAAVGPSMGRHTIPSAGIVAAVVNLRPGRWLPNPFNRYSQRKVRERMTHGPLDHDQGMGPGYNELIPELTGITGKKIYVSDGGHDDNLGLVVLLRAKCSEIWCVDSSAERNGRAAELRRVLAEAQGQLRLKSVDVACDAFAAGPNGLFGTTHVTGRVVYEDDSIARITVIKLGLCAASDPALLAKPRSRWGWPHHSTIRQVYPRARMDAYRRLGADSAGRAVTAFEVAT